MYKNQLYLYTLVIRNLKMYWPINIKYLGISLTKFVQGMFNEKYKTLIREIKDQLDKQLYHVHDEDTVLERCQFFTN